MEKKEKSTEKNKICVVEKTKKGKYLLFILIQQKKRRVNNKIVCY
jgi:hypothetical protein